MRGFFQNVDQIQNADLRTPDQALRITRDNPPSPVGATIANARARGSRAMGTLEQSDRAFRGRQAAQSGSSRDA